MSLHKLPAWLQKVVASLGGLGIFVVAFLDSSVLTFPVINDLLVIQYSIWNPNRMAYYALMATLGSVAGCLFLYFLARKGGHAMLHRHAGPRAARFHAWIEHNGFWGVLVAALLPPPTPFKLFVIAAGVFELPLRAFVLALLLARSFRYYGVGYLAVRYGPQATHYLMEHKLRTSLLTLAVVVLAYGLMRLVLRRLQLHH